LDNQDFEEQEEEEEDISEFYCVVCDKAYKSERQFTSHESSKRHLENVEILRQEMLADEENFELQDGVPLDIDAGIPVENNDDLSADLEQLDLSEQEEPEIIAINNNKKKKKKNKNKMTPHWGFDEETIPDDMDEMSMLAAALEEEKSRRRRKGNNRAVSPAPADTEQDDTPIIEKESAKTKREKRKEKKKLKEESGLTEVSN
jgi:DnaJ family protein A protein 5